VESAEALAARDASAPETQEVESLRRWFDNQGASLRAIVSDLPDIRRRRLCLLVDQFEELFQYARERSHEEATLFVDLISAALEDDTGSPFRVILTMRSDFLGECVGWPNLAGAVNRAQYLLPPMDPIALRYAICRPGELYQGQVDPKLADRTIADVQGAQDQLPLIQHGLMRLWDLAAETNGTRRLDVALYEKHGPLTRILDEHADEIARNAEPGNDDLPLTSRIFRALSDLNDAGQPIRRPQTMKELIAVTSASETRVRAVVDAFRADGVSFLRPYEHEPLDDKESVDIAHEALMRCWKRLADRTTGWLWDEFRQGLAWQALLAQAELFLENRRNVLSSATTEDRTKWLSGRTDAWATRHGGGWDKITQLMAASQASARRLQFTRYSLGLIALLAVISAGFGIYFSLSAARALNDLYTAQAKFVWSEIGTGSDNDSLTPRQANALWEIASGAPQVRKRFLELLSTDPEFAVRFGAHVSLISRALGLTWPESPNQAQAALGPVLEAIAKTTDSNRLGPLAQVAAALAPKLTPNQAQAALGPVLEAIAKTTSPHALGSLAQAAAALGPKVRPERAQAALGSVLAAIAKTTDPFALGPLGQAAAALAPKLTPEQAQAALGPVLEAIAKTTDSNQLGSLAQAAAVLAPKLTPEQAQAALGPVLAAIPKTTDSNQLGPLAQAAAVLAPKLTPEQADTALGPVLEAIAKTTNPSALQSLTRAAAALAPRLPSEQAQAALGPVLDAIAKTSDSNQLGPLAQVAAALAPKLTPEQAHAALGPVLEAIAKTTDSDQRRLRAAAALGPVLGMIANTPIPYAFGSLSGGDRSAVTGGARVRSDWLRVQAQAAATLAAKLAPEQAQAVLGLFLETIAKITDSGQLGSLAQAAAALAPKLTPEQAQATLGSFLDAITKTTNPPALESPAQAAAEPALKPEQAQAALGPVLEAIAKTTDSDQLQSLAQAAAALAPRLSPEHAQAALGRVGSALGWSVVAGEAQEWVKAFVALLARVPDPKSSSRAIVDVMKYPITAGEPTDELLLALKQYLPQLPGSDAGLSLNLDWLKRNEPSIDLISRAVCPPPPREQLHCPIQAGS